MEINQGFSLASEPSQTLRAVVNLVRLNARSYPTNREFETLDLFSVRANHFHHDSIP
jgi:hypothetical protein